MRKRALSLLLAMALVLGLSVGASAASAAPTDLNRYLLSHTSRSGETRSLPIDRTEVNEHPVIGYYTYTFQDGEAARPLLQALCGPALPPSAPTSPS